MGAVPNCLRRAGIYYFRRTIPIDVKPALRRCELCCSLRTNDVTVARSLSRSLYLLSEELFALIRSLPMLTKSDLSRLVRSFYQTVLERENQLRLLGRMSLTEEQRLAKSAHYAEVAAQARQDLATNKFESVDFIAAAMIKQHGYSGKLDDLEVRQVQQAMMRASCDLAEAMKARFEGDFNYQPQDALLEAELQRVEDREPAGKPSAAAAGPQISEPDSAHSPMFVERAEEFRQTQERLSVWDPQTALQARSTYKLFAELCNDRPIGGYVRGDAVRFKDMLRELPAAYGKAAEYRNLKGAEIVAAVAKKDIPRLSPRTVQRHLSALSALWKNAVEQGQASTNIFAGFKLPTQKKPQDQRDMWSSDKLQQLFQGPLWSGCQSKDRRSKPGSVIVRDEKFWLPLIALFSGMRQEEICQLLLEDVRLESGVWVFDINDRPPRQLKNRNAVRLVPIHKELQGLGFLDYVEEQRTAGRERVFHQLDRGGADQRFGHNFTKWFTRYRKDVGLYAPGLDFHSFRHSATTFMTWGGVDVRTIDNVTGHATPGETARYTKSFQVEQLKQAIDAIDPKIDLGHLLPGSERQRVDG